MTIETEREEDGRWLAEVMEILGAMAYGQTRAEAIRRARIVAEDCADLGVIQSRRNEPTIAHEDLKKELKRNGILL